MASKLSSKKVGSEVGIYKFTDKCVRCASVLRQFESGYLQIFDSILDNIASTPIAQIPDLGGAIGPRSGYNCWPSSLIF